MTTENKTFRIGVDSGGTKTLQGLVNIGKGSAGRKKKKRFLW